MATWKDGPRYAPAERPAGFAAPTTGVSLAAPALPPTVPPAPAAPPAGFQPGAPGVPLGAIQAAPADERDPQVPFRSLTLVLTPGFGEGPLRPRTPLEPFHVVSAVASPAASPAPPPAPPTSYPVALRDVGTAAYPPLLILLVVLGFVALSSPFFAVLVLVAAPFVLVPRVRFRVGPLRWTTFAILGGLAILWVISFFLDASMYNVDLHLPVWTLVACWSLAAADVLLQYLGLRAGERPNHVN
ncbi:MAG: hypothetical protein LBI33_04955 [Propionibacteriaceae bacterium]|jgi:hypothetical protein|nr:hypothetical protein [Propionibacteriaceae bacterium]